MIADCIIFISPGNKKKQSQNVVKKCMIVFDKKKDGFGTSY